MSVWRIAATTALAVTGAAGIARAAPPPPGGGFAVTIAGPESAELGAWTDVRVDVDNLAPDGALQPHLTLNLPEGAARPAAASGATCAGVSAVECTLPTVPGAGRVSVTLPVRWSRPGAREVEARIRPETADPGSVDAVATAVTTVGVYALVLRDLRSNPARPRPGRRYTASATLARSDTGEPLRSRALRCSGGLSVVPRGPTRWSAPGAASLRGARLTCTWRVPTTVRNQNGTVSNVRGWYFQALLLADTRPNGMVTKLPFLRRVR